MEHCAGASNWQLNIIRLPDRVVAQWRASASTRWQVLRPGMWTLTTEYGRDLSLSWSSSDASHPNSLDLSPQRARVFLRLAMDGVEIRGDPLGRQPIFFASEASMVSLSNSFATLVRGLHSVQRNIWAAARIALLGFSGDGETPLLGVRCLGAGSTLHVGLNAIERKPNHELLSSQVDAKTPAVSDIREVVRSALLKRLAKPASSSAVLLSGGLDSRLLAAELRDLGIPFQTITFGTHLDRDSILGPQVAAVLGVANRFAPLVGKTLLQHWQPYALLSGGMSSVTNSWYRVTRSHLPYDGITFHGLAGDLTLGGGFHKRFMLRPCSLDFLARHLLSRFQKVECGFVSRLFGIPSSTFFRTTSNWFLEALDRFRYATTPAMLCDLFVLYHKVPFDTVWCLVDLNRAAPVTTPLHDVNVVRFFLAIPGSSRYKHRLYKEMFRQAWPSLAKIAWQKEGLDLYGDRDLSLHGLARRIPYAAWMGGELLEYVKKELLGEGSLLRDQVDHHLLSSWLRHRRLGDREADFLGALLAIKAVWQEVEEYHGQVDHAGN